MEPKTHMCLRPKSIECTHGQCRQWTLPDGIIPQQQEACCWEVEMKHSSSFTAQDRLHGRQGGHKRLLQRRAGLFNLLNHPANTSQSLEWRTWTRAQGSCQHSHALWSAISFLARCPAAWRGLLESLCCFARWVSVCRGGNWSAVRLVSVLQRARAVAEVNVFGFPLLVTGGCMAACCACSSAPIIACLVSQVCCWTGRSPAPAWSYEQKGGASHSWAVRDGQKHSLRLGHLQVQHRSKALSLWQPVSGYLTLGKTEVRKPWLNL